MREIKFILPNTDAYSHTALRKELAMAAGGFTVTPCTGGWFDPDLQEVVTEENLQYCVGSSDLQTVAKVRRIAVHYGKEVFNQKALYFVEPSGDARIIDLTEEFPV